MKSSNVIAVFARAPVPGQVKTRLAAYFGVAAATELYSDMLRDCLTLVGDTAQRIGNCKVCVVFTPADAFAPGPHTLAPFWGGKRIEQRGGDLGEKMRNAFVELFARGATKAVIIGSDSPDLPPEFIVQAFTVLETADLVFGPARDGGFYLIGAVREVPLALFEGVPWSAPNTLERTLENAARLGLSFHLTPEWDDVDEPDDVQNWERRRKQTAQPY